jgi:hypothetical protein
MEKNFKEAKNERLRRQVVHDAMTRLFIGSRTSNECIRSFQGLNNKISKLQARIPNAYDRWRG